jgi:predicted XRE-type DNA-binding protein
MADNKHRGPTLDSFLEQEGVLGEFQARAIKEVIAWQLADAMKERKLSKNRLATMMHTSRTQVDRVLDPKDGNVTIETLQRAAAVVGRRVQLELV